jgi:hypothetical protein
MPQIISKITEGLTVKQIAKKMDSKLQFDLKILILFFIHLNLPCLVDRLDDYHSRAIFFLVDQVPGVIIYTIRFIFKYRRELSSF